MNKDSSKRRGGLIVLSAPSGAGKSTVAEKLIAAGVCERAVTATTRAPRGQEKDGVDYFFMTPEAFDAGVAKDEFLEHANVFGRMYGVPRRQVEARVAAGVKVLLVIDVQGGMTIRAKYPEALLVFLTPPSLEVLEARLRGRKTDDEETMRTRLDTARAEMEYRDRYDVCVVNDDLDRCVEDVKREIRKRFDNDPGRV